MKRRFTGIIFLIVLLVCTLAISSCTMGGGLPEDEKGNTIEEGKSVEVDEGFYYNLAFGEESSFGFSVSIKNLELAFGDRSAEVGISEIKQIGSCEMMLGLDGDNLLCGAFACNVSVKTAAADVTDYVMYGILQNEKVYMELESKVKGEDGFTKETVSFVMNFDEFIESIVGPEGAPDADESEGELSFEQLLQTYTLQFEVMTDLFADYIEDNKAEVDKLVKNLADKICVLEYHKTHYVLRLDFDKAADVVADMGELTLSELCDEYYGEDSFVDFVEELSLLMETELSKLTEYLESKGVNSDALYDLITEYSIMMGSPEDFDFYELINSDQYKDLTLGEVMYESEDQAEEVILSLVSSGEKTLCEILGAEKEYFEELEQTLRALKDQIDHAIITDTDGFVTGKTLSVRTEEEQGEKYVFYLEYKVNGEIDVTWEDIVDRIEGGEEPPAPPADDEEGGSGGEGSGDTDDDDGPTYVDPDGWTSPG